MAVHLTDRRGARDRTANMSTLIAIGTLAAFTFPTLQLFTGGDLYFDTTALVIAFLPLGRSFEARAKRRVSGAIRALLELGAKDAIVIVDGDELIGAQVGIDTVLALVFPADKAAEVARLQSESDGPIESSDITLLADDLTGVATALPQSRRTFWTILQNLGWAFGYNTAAISLAALGPLNPIITGAAMAFSNVSVVTNSLRLYPFRKAEA